MPDLIATRAMTYATRALQAGDPFQASNQHARILIAIKKARPAVEVDGGASTARTLAPAPAAQLAGAPDIDNLRHQAAQLGITVSTRWGEKRLQEEIAKAAKA